MKAGKMALRMAEIASWLMKHPRTLNELAELVGVAPDDRLRAMVKAFRDEGLVYVSDHVRISKFGGWRKVFAWQPSPFMREDVPPPPVVPRTARYHARRAMLAAPKGDAETPLNTADFPLPQQDDLTAALFRRSA